MKPIRKPRLSPIEQRKQQLAKQIDELRQQAATKTQKSFKTDKGCSFGRMASAQFFTSADAILPKGHFQSSAAQT